MSTFGAVVMVALTVQFFREDDQWTAHCLELGTATCADTLAEAQVAITDMIGLHLQTLDDLGIQGKFLKEHGVTL